MFSVLSTERRALGLGTGSKSGSPLASIIPEIIIHPSGLPFYEFLFLQCASVHCSSSCTWFTRTIVSDIKASHMNSTFGTNRLCLYKVAWEHFWALRKDVYLGCSLPFGWNKIWICTSAFTLFLPFCVLIFTEGKQAIQQDWNHGGPGQLPGLDDLGNQDLEA